MATMTQPHPPSGGMTTTFSAYSKFGNMADFVALCKRSDILDGPEDDLVSLVVILQRLCTDEYRHGLGADFAVNQLSV